MLFSFNLVDPANPPQAFWKRTKIPSEIIFSNGLNFLCGPNGCGKSTLLNLFATHFQCKQGGVPTLTESSIRELTPNWSIHNKKKMKQPFDYYEIEHDGGLVCYFSPDSKVGLVGGSAFDDDFFMEGVLNCTSRLSSGRNTQSGLMRILTLIRDNKVKKEYKFSRKKCNDVWRKKYDDAEKLSEATVPTDKPVLTLLLDEPERALDARALLVLHSVLAGLSSSIQVICATHNPIFMGLKDANFIDFEKDYSKTVREMLFEAMK